MSIEIADSECGRDKELLIDVLDDAEAQQRARDVPEKSLSATPSAAVTC